MKKLLLFLTLFLSVTSVHAEWVSMGKSDTGENYIKVDSIKYKNKIASYWDLRDFKVLQKGKHLSIKTKKEDNCNTDQYRVLTMVGYSGNMGEGEVTLDEDGSGKWIYVVPGTMGEAVHNFVCNKK
jgi:hypothetical protein